MSAARLTPLLFGAAAALACSRGTVGEAELRALVTVVFESGGDPDLDLGRARLSGTGNRAARSGDELVVRAAEGTDVRVPGACPARVDPRAPRRALTPLYDFGAPLTQVGYGARFRLEARAGCAEAGGPITWRQVDGPALSDVEVTARSYSARLPERSAALGPHLPWGVVPISAARRGAVTLEATWVDGSGEAHARTVTVSAAPRSRGLPNVPVGTRVYLGGDGWQVVSRPPGSRAELETPAALLPDAGGRYVLRDGSARELRLFAGRYDETPLDCGRSECHAAIAETARTNPMTTIFARGLGAPFPGDYPGCALGCHTLGETGIDDGGFASLAASMGASPGAIARTGFHELPPALRRVSGVSCLACHGPGAIPEPAARWALLRADVCATCHDAPPRYGHVEAWRTSRMARSDEDPRTRAGACARCHTTWGFLGAEGREPPSQVGAIGITCQACHAVHPASVDARAGKVCAAALPREVTVPRALEGAVPGTVGPSGVCLPCHTPAPDDRFPSASSAALWLGRGGVDPDSGAPLEGAAPHAAVNGGCVGCHRAGPEGLARGGAHGFSADATSCDVCHAERTDPEVARRAERLWAQLLGMSSGAGPAHAGAANVALDRRTRRGRAAWDVALVREDHGAAAHNAPYARALLDAAERVLGGPP